MAVIPSMLPHQAHGQAERVSEELVRPTSITGLTAILARPLGAKLGERLSAADFGASPSPNRDPFGNVREAFGKRGGGVIYLPTDGATGWLTDSYGNPEGMSFEADGPRVDGNRLLGLGPGILSWGKAWSARLPSNNTEGVTAYSMIASAPGSGSGTSDQTVLHIQANKERVQLPSQVALGGLGGMFIDVYNSSPHHKTNDTYALNTFVQVGYASGFAVISEDKIQEHCIDNYNLCYEADRQLEVEDSSEGTHIGENWTADLGVHQALLRAVGSVVGGNQTTAAYRKSGVTGRWGNIILNQLDGVTNFELVDTGAIVTSSDGSSATRIVHRNVAGSDTVQNGRGETLVTLDQSGSESFKGAIRPGLSNTNRLPDHCIVGDQLYDVDGRKLGESLGHGSGVPVVCSATYRGGPTGWFSMFSGELVRN